MEWLLAPRIAARGHFSRGSVLLSSFVAIHMTLIFYSFGSARMGLGLILMAWVSTTAFVAMLGAALVLGLAFKAIEPLRPNLVMYVLCGAAAGLLHFVAGTTLRFMNDHVALILTFWGGFWMSAFVSGANEENLLRALFAEGAAGSVAGAIFALFGTRPAAREAV